MLEEEVLAKKGPELFKELLRIYPIAEVEDYHKNGVWKEECMKIDLALIYTHRREGGAPDPPPLEEVIMPEMPKPMMAAIATIPGGIRLPMAVRPLGLPTMVKAGVQPFTPAKAGIIATAAAASGPAAELRLIALFVAKWKLDPTRTKMMLAKLTPTRRRSIIQSFKATAPGADVTAALEQFIAQGGGSEEGAGAGAGAETGPSMELRLIAQFVAKWRLDPTRAKMLLARLSPPKRRYIIQNFKVTAPGADATAALVEYIVQCERSNAWAGAAPMPTLAPNLVAARPTAAAVPSGFTANNSGGVKRPLTPGILNALRPGNGEDPNKRPRVASTISPRPLAPTIAARPSTPYSQPTIRYPSGATPRPAAAVRPGMLTPKAPSEKPGDLIRNLLRKF